MLRGQTGTRAWGLGPAMGDPPTETLLSLDAPETVQYSDDASFVGQLTDRDGVPIAGAELTLELPESSQPVETDSSGLASVERSMTVNPGVYELTLSYGGTGDYASATVTRDLSVTREDSVLKLRRIKRDLVARLWDHDARSNKIAGGNVTFFAGSHKIGSAKSGSDGVADLAIPTRFRSRNSFRARFAGDSFYTASRASSGN